MATKNRKPRLSIEGIRNNHKCDQLSNKGLKNQKETVFHILDGRPEYAALVDPVKKCTPRHRCNSKYCPHCSNPRNRTSKRQAKPDHQITEGACNGTSTALGTLSSNYQVRGGQTMIAPFVGLPLILLHCITINLALVALDGNLKAEADKMRQRLRRALSKLSDEHIVRGKLDMALKAVDDLPFEIIEQGEVVDHSDPDTPSKRMGMLHIHFALFDPWLSADDIRAILVDEFPGKKRVCVRATYEDVVHADGTVTHGLQGYLEYASLEKVEISFGRDSVQAVLEFAKLDMTWSRRNRTFSSGKRPDDISTIVDPDRVKELEIERFKKKVKKNWTKLTYAERFLHIWISDAKMAMQTVKDRTYGTYLDGFVDRLSLLLSNWSQGVKAGGSMFIGVSRLRSTGLFGRLIAQRE